MIMDLKNFSSNNDFIIDIVDSSINYDDVMNSLYMNRNMVETESLAGKNNNADDNMHITIRDDSISRDMVIQSLNQNFPRIENIIYNQDFTYNLDIGQTKINVKDTFISPEKVIDNIISNKPLIEYDDSKTIADNRTDRFAASDGNESGISIDRTSEEKTEDNTLTDINKATEEELRALPGMRLVHSKKIIQLRQFNIFINSFKDLEDKIGLNADEINSLKPYVIIGKVSGNTILKHGRLLDL